MAFQLPLITELLHLNLYPNKKELKFFREKKFRLWKRNSINGNALVSSTRTHHTTAEQGKETVSLINCQHCCLSKSRV